MKRTSRKTRKANSRKQEAIRAISLSNPLVEETTADTSDEETLDDSTHEAGTPNDVLIVLRVTGEVASR